MLLDKKNNSVWRSNHGDLRFVFDSEENPLVPLRLDLDISLGLLQVKYFFRPKHISTCNHMKLLALHCNPLLVFCGGHFLTLPSHNNGTKIEMNNDQSYAPQLPVSKAFLVVVWLSYLQTRPSRQRYPRPPCLRGPRARDCFQCHLLESPVLQAKTRPPDRITNPSVSAALFFALIS